ncbi:potassium channel family protein [soil metagenome]
MTQQRWQRITEWPLMGIAVLFLVTYAWQVIAEAQGTLETVTDVILNATWVVFIVDYLVTLVLAKPRWRWFYRHLLDLAIVALPLLRPLRLLRLITLLRALQRVAGSALRGRVVIYVAGAASLLIFVAALAELDQERHAPGASIVTFPDGLWWAIVTMTTVGYGDLYPVTDVGRWIAVAVMLGGIALIGVVTATFASWIVERISQNDELEQAATRRQVADLTDEVRALRALLTAPPERPAQARE